MTHKNRKNRTKEEEKTSTNSNSVRIGYNARQYEYASNRKHPLVWKTSTCKVCKRFPRRLPISVTYMLMSSVVLFVDFSRYIRCNHKIYLSLYLFPIPMVCIILCVVPPFLPPFFLSISLSLFLCHFL